MHLRVMLHGAIRSNDFKRNTALQNCCDIDSNGCNSVPTLPAMLCHGWLFQVVNIANNASLCAMELNVNEEIFLQTTKLQLLVK